MEKQARQNQFETSFGKYQDFTLLERIVKKLEVHRAAVMTRLVPRQGSCIVDLACGDGTLLYTLASGYKKIIGFDIARNRIARAKKLLKKTKALSNFFVKDLDKGIPLPSKSVDVVTCEASLAYFLQPDSVLAEVHRILRPKGIIVVQIGNYAFLPRRIALLFGYLPKISSFRGFGDGGMIHYFTYESLQDLLEQCGFKVQATECSGLLPQIRKLWPSLLASDIIYQAVKVEKKRT